MANEMEIDILDTAELNTGTLPEDGIVAATQAATGNVEDVIMKKVLTEEIVAAPNTPEDVELKWKHRWPLPIKEMCPEIQHAFGIVKDLASVAHRSINWPFVEGVDCQVDSMTDYKEVIKSPVWLKKILESVEGGKYKGISEVIGDIRLMLENCYRYHGPDHSFTKKGLQLEHILEQKLAVLPRELRDKTLIEVTSGDLIQDDDSARRRSLRHNISYNSVILNKVRHEKAERDRVLRKRNSEVRKAEKEGKEKEVEEWEEKLTEGPVLTQMKAMWELPQIGHFLFLCQAVLNTPEVPQYELERILIMPRQSILLAKIMTSLLTNRNQRSKLDRLPPMPYKIWHHKLVVKLQAWYKVFNAKEQKPNLAFELLGIEPAFFKVLGTTNPLDEKPFHGLTFHQRVWVLKGLCDHILHKYKAVQDVMNDQQMEDLREYMLGTDSEDNLYLHFPQFCGQDLRIYRQSKWIPPKLPSLKPVTPKRGTKAGKRQSRSSKRKKSRAGRPLKSKRSREMSSDDEHLVNGESKDDDPTEEFEDASVEPCIQRFELIVDSVESLKELVAKFEAKNVQAPKSKRNKTVQPEPSTNNEMGLLQSLKNLYAELEPWDSKLQQAMRRTRQRLKKEYEEFMLHGVIKHEQNHELIWKSDDEDDEQSIPDSGESVHERSNPSSDYDPSEDRRRSKRSAVKKKTLQIALKEAERKARQDRVEKRQFIQDQERVSNKEDLDDEDDEEDDEEVVEYTDVSSRGRVRKIRTVRAKTEALPKLKSVKAEKPVNGKVGILQNHSRQNTQVQAERHLAWESLRQILVQPTHKRDEVVPLDAAKPAIVHPVLPPAAEKNPVPTPVKLPPTTPLQTPTIISRNRIFTSKDMISTTQNSNSTAPTRKIYYIIPKQNNSQNSLELAKSTAACKVQKVTNATPRAIVPTTGVEARVIKKTVFEPYVQKSSPCNVAPKVIVKQSAPTRDVDIVEQSAPKRDVEKSPVLVMHRGMHTYSKVMPETNSTSSSVVQTSNDVPAQTSTAIVPHPVPIPSSTQEGLPDQLSGSISDLSVQNPELTPAAVDATPASVDTTPASAEALVEGSSTVNLSVVCIEDHVTNTKQLGVILPDGQVLLLDSLIAAANNGDAQTGTFTIQLPSEDI